MPLGPSLPAPLLAATAVGLGSIDVPVPATVALVGMTWRFIRPVRPGEAISARWRLNRKRDVENVSWGLATWQVDVLGADGEACATGEVTRLVARRSALPSADGQATGGTGRRRRRRRSTASVAAPTPEALVEIPEPAPADVPAPARRRRRRRSGGGNGGNGGGGTNGGSGSGAGGASSGGVAGHGGDGSPAEGRPAADPPPPAAASVESSAEPKADDAGLGRVLRRIRRR